MKKHKDTSDTRNTTDHLLQKPIYISCLLLAAVLVSMALSLTSVQAAKLPALKVKGTQLVNANGKAVQLKGVSTHGLSWFPGYVDQRSFDHIKKTWKANCVRLAMYTSEYNGYCTGDAANRTQLEQQIDKGVRCATKAGLYVIIDWHILSDGNPRTYEKQAVRFFKKMASKYKKHTNVLYEICNEPNNGTSWSTIKTYAQKVIKAIRAQDKDGIILIGTPNWSQDVDTAADNPVKGYKNLMYTLHFYAGTHGSYLREKAATALKKKLPLFVSEFGISDASGNGALNEREGAQWMKFLKKHKISYIGWNLSNKQESTSLLKPSCQKIADWKNADLSPWGKWLIRQF